MRKRAEKIIFLVFLMYYIFIGMCVTYFVVFDSGYFGADNGRVYTDMLTIAGDHYRLKVHPLFLYLIQPVMHLAQGLCHSERVACILLETLCGACSVLLVFKILEKLKVDVVISVIFTIIYGGTFSTLFFSTIPETFIFSGTLLLLFWYFILSVDSKKENLSLCEYILLFFFGITSFGLVITNYIVFLIGLIYLIVKRYSSTRDSLIAFLKCNIINSVGIMLLSIWQKIVWKDSPFWLSSILDIFSTSGSYEEFDYMDWSISFTKLVTYVKQIIVYPIMCPSYKMYHDEELGWHPVWFEPYTNKISKLVVICFLVIIALLVIRMISNCIATKTITRIMPLLITLIFNLCLHFIYSYGESFIYSAHYMGIFMILGAIALNDVSNGKVKWSLSLFIGLFAVYMIINNTTALMALNRDVLDYLQIEFSYKKPIQMTAFAGTLGIMWYFISNKHNNYELNEKVAAKMVVSYMLFAFISSAFIGLFVTWI